MTRLSLGSLGLVLGGLLLLPPAPAAPASATTLRVQTVGDVAYFHVRLDAPGLVPEGPLPWMEVTPETLPLAREWWPAPAPSLVPRLIPSGPEMRLVCRTPATGRAVEFVGRFDPRAGAVKATLHYPTRDGAKLAWKLVPVVLDFKTAQRGEVLERLWAKAQVEQFDALDADAPDFGFYSFAATALTRKYDLPGLRIPATKEARPAFSPARLYELTTGASAISESLQLRRMTAGANPEEPRTMDPATIQGIDIAEHPWKAMMGDKKPADEPLAKMIPHDNYFVTFRDPAKMLGFASLLDTWGGNLTRAFEFTSRDYRLWQRYERQLCLDSAALGQNLAALGIKGVAITGNDAYLRDGTDITLLLPMDEPKKWRAAQEPYLDAARRNFGDKLIEVVTRSHGISIESFVSPLREVSLHRAVVDKVVILSNSPVGLRRVLDAAKGQVKRLSDSLDFQYMRTIFRADDKGEDGFAYLPDAFIRAFVGPASRIKQKRRLEALTSLHMLTHGALLTAWETGKLPASSDELLRVSGLREAEIAIPEGAPTWDAASGAAVSKVHGSIHFATPLVELPFGLVTPTEAREYKEFRDGYLRLWRRFFDPIGMRVALRDGQVKLETYILPLIDSEFYNQLRQIAGNGTVRIDPASFAPTTLLQYRTHMNPTGVRPGGLPQLQLLGEWFLLRLDDGPDYAKLFRAWQQPANATDGFDELLRRTAGLPLAVGVAVKDEKAAAQLVKQALPLLPFLFADRWTREADGTEIYKGVSVPWVRFVEAREDIPDKQRTRIGLRVAVFDGAAYATLTEAMMHRLIDEAMVRKEKKPEPLAHWPAFVNSSVYVSPAAVGEAKPVLTRLAEMPTNQEARSALGAWYALYRAGLVPPDAKPEAADNAAFHFLGYVPTAPDRTAYRYDPATDEVLNERHGSFRQPALATGLARTSPLARVLENLRSVRVDLRFREDGIHTTLTLTRKGGTAGTSREALKDAMFAAFSSPDRAERRLAREELERRGLQGKPTLPGLTSALVEALKVEDRIGRCWIIDELARHGPEAREAVPALQLEMYDSSQEVRLAAVAALRKIAPGAELPENLKPSTRAALLERLKRNVKSADRDECWWAAEMLLNMSPETFAPLLDGLTRSLASADYEERRSAVENLLNLGPAANATHPAIRALLTRTLQSPDPSRSRWAAETLGRFGSEAKEVVSWLQVALYDRSPDVRLAATAALAKIDPTAKVQAAEMSPEVKGRIRDRLIQDLKITRPQDLGYPEARVFAAESLGQLGAEAMAAVPALLAARNDLATEVRRAAEDALRKIDPEAAKKAGVR